MPFRKITIGAALISILSTTMTPADPGSRKLNAWGSVLDRLFPLNVESQPYFSKMILRFYDSNTQLVVLVYPGGKAELIRYWVSSPAGELLSAFISKIPAELSDADMDALLTRIKVSENRSPIDGEALDRALKKLKPIRISPMLATRVCLDACSEYEFWYDTGEESLHYLLTGPGNSDPQDELVKWMIDFRARATGLIISVPAQSRQ